MIQIRNLTRQVGKTRVLDNISLTVEKQETLVVAGPAGSGKTTLLRVISGLDPPDKGEIHILGAKASRDDKIIIPPEKRNLGMIFQDLALWPHMTALENIAFGLKANGFKKTEQHRKIRKLCDRIDIEPLLQRYPEHLSGGEKQKIALARTLVLEPAVLLLDEPLNSLDAVLKDDLLNTIRSLVKHFQITLIYVTHSREEAAFLSSRICVMIKGKISQTGFRQQLLDNPESDFITYFLREVR